MDAEGWTRLNTKRKKDSASGRLVSRIEKASLSLNPANWDPPAPFFLPWVVFLFVGDAALAGLPLNKPGAVLPLLFTDSSSYRWDAIPARRSTGSFALGGCDCGNGRLQAKGMRTKRMLPVARASDRPALLDKICVQSCGIRPGSLPSLPFQSPSSLLPRHWMQLVIFDPFRRGDQVGGWLGWHGKARGRF